MDGSGPPGPHSGKETQLNTNDMTAIRMKGKRACNGVYISQHSCCYTQEVLKLSSLLQARDATSKAVMGPSSKQNK